MKSFLEGGELVLAAGLPYGYGLRHLRQSADGRVHPAADNPREQAHNDEDQTAGHNGACCNLPGLAGQLLK
ncbi:hypothetical protein D3C81_2225190 [compost metagenome]